MKILPSTAVVIRVYVYDIIVLTSGIYSVINLRLFLCIRCLNINLFRLLSKHFCLQPLLLKDWVSLLFAKISGVSVSVRYQYLVRCSHSRHQGWDPWKIHFQHFLTSKDILSITDKHNSQIGAWKSVTNPLVCFVGVTILFVTRYDKVRRLCLV